MEVFLLLSYYEIAKEFFIFVKDIIQLHYALQKQK
jgi:hypothetical protein